MKTTIVVADSKRLVREGIRGLLTSNSDLDVVGEVEGGREALAMILELAPMVAIIDAQLSQMAGIEVTRRLRDADSPTRCVVVSSYTSPSQIRDALAAGAAGFLPTDAGAADLLDCVATVAAGRTYLASVSNQVVSLLMAPDVASRGGRGDLTARQREILHLISEGMSTKEIAVELCISDKTVETHRARLMNRLGIRKASSLVRYAIREGIVSA